MDLSKLKAQQLRDLCRLQLKQIQKLEAEIKTLRSLSFWYDVRKQFKIDK